jgi:dihydroorotate dehydrogenase electron transfer subunit
MMHQEKAIVLENSKVANDCYRLRLKAKSIAKDSNPGQFVHIKIASRDQQPFLRRPFAVHRKEDKQVFSLLYKVRGLTTKLMSQLEADDIIDVIGPLGSGFRPSSDVAKYILIAGGIGLAPLFFLAQELMQNKKEVIVMYGARDKKGLACTKELSEINIKPLLATDDGSHAFKGSVNTLLKEYLDNNKKDKVEVFAAGPRGMLKETAGICRKAGVCLQVSMDEIMACGVGACLGCAVKTKDGYKLACKDGPVFKAKDIIWE